MTSERLIGRAALKSELNVNLGKNWPVEVWVSTHVGVNADGLSEGYTLGLAAMGGVEFEALGSPEVPRELELRLKGLARYTVFKIKTIYNGDTTGVDEIERIRLKKVVSETIHKGWVFRLLYEKTSDGKSWWT